MQYKTVRYKRKKKLSNDEFQIIEISAELDNEDDVELCIAQLMSEVDSMLQVGSYANEDSALSKIKAMEVAIKSKNKDENKSDEAAKQK